jgi:hypothetical protein
MHGHLPREYLEKFTRENPRLAALVLVFGAVMIGFALWLALSDP